ncbi:MAG: MurR/RpiR family transcriptional regulator [Bauldia sp.]|uniref:MurR/RpiR family transcriptional regulator n=1 Tax=Bauldia sp. TaxID=2575872 RepID=UPI001DAA1095|nr:MurR/RpiR family transcriptional regulator [Bauldia sp.]MCB1495736.1 MurR/RpiR family transcriptional regulator [Bauldia sp.]
MSTRTSEEPPRDFDGLKDLLISRRESLPRRLVQVAAFALENPDEVAFGTVASVAAQAKVQPSTLIRFAQTLGYAGFTDLQDVFRAQLKSHWPDYRERLARIGDRVNDRRDGTSGLLDGFAETAIASIDRLRHTVSTAEIDRAATLLAEADTIYLIGLRRVFPVSSYLAYALAKIGCRAVLIDNVAALGPEQLIGATAKDVLVAVSFSPYAPITVELTTRAAERGVPVIAITDSPFSPLSSNATIQLEVVEADFAGFRSLSATLALAMALAVAAGARREARG